MRRGCRLKSLFGVLLTGVLLLAGCRPAPPADTLRLGEWIEMLRDGAGIMDSTADHAYFLNVGPDSPYYSSVQAAAEWGILDTSMPFDPDAALTREWAVCTLISFAGIPLSDHHAKITDLGQSDYPKHMAAACAWGLIKPDRRGRVYPKEIISAQEAEEMLQKVLYETNHRNFENSEAVIVLKDDLQIREIEADRFDPETLCLESEETINPGELITFRYRNNSYTYIADRTEEGVVYLREPDGEILEELDVQGSFDMDFSDAESYTGSTGSVLERPLKLAALQAYTKAFDVSGFHVALRAAGGSVSADISKQLRQRADFSAQFSVSHVTPSYKWKIRGGKIEYGYFRADFSASEKAAVSATKGAAKRADFSALQAGSFLQAAAGLFKAENEAVDTVLPLCTLHVPVPQIPAVTVDMRLGVRLGAEGRAEAALMQNGTVGIEIRNGACRMIRDIKPDGTVMMNASLHALADITFGMSAVSVQLADVTLDGGAEAKVSSVLHLYDDHGKHSTVKTDVPADFLMDAAEGNGNVLVCADADAYWLLTVSFNSPGTLAGRFGYSAEIPLLQEGDFPLLPGGRIHMENGQKVAACTRGEREYRESSEDTVKADALTIAQYAVNLSAGESASLRITGIPEGYSKADLVYTSDHPESASVDSSGRITAIAEGSAVITVSTKDGRYSVKCSACVHG